MHWKILHQNPFYLNTNLFIKNMNIGILGASTNLGFSFVNLIKQQKVNIRLLRNKSNLNHFSECSICENTNEFFNELNTIFSLIPIWIFSELLTSNISNLKCDRIIVISSTSASTKLNSKDKWERDYARKFLIAEKKISEICMDLNIKLLIIRPTMIWGRKSDLNVSFLMKFIVNYGFLILPSLGRGIRYPIHVNQLAKCIKDLSNREEDGLFNILGPQKITYLNMCKEIFLWFKFKPLILIIPSFFYGFIIFISKNLFKKKYINKESFLRIDYSPDMGYGEPKNYVAEGSFKAELNDLCKPTFCATVFQFFYKKFHKIYSFYKF